MKKNVFFKVGVSLLLISSLLIGCKSKSPETKETDNEPATNQTEGTAKGDVAAGADTGTGDKTKIVMITTGTGSWEKPFEKIEAAFEEENPNIDFSAEFYGHEQLFQVIEVKVGAGSDEYDVIAVDVPVIAGYTERGYLLPLDAYFTDAEKNEFIPSAVEAATWKNQFMAPPMNTSAQLLFYNKDLLDQAGVEYPSEDIDKRISWEELTAMAEKVLNQVDPDRNQGYSGLTFEQVSRAYQILALPNSLGEKSIGSDGFTVDGVVNTDGWVKAMTFYRDTFENKISLRGVKSEENGPAFRAGKTAFYVGGTWNFNSATAEGLNFGFAPHPYFEGFKDKVATPTGSWHVGVSAFSKKQDEAAAFAKFITLGKGSDIWLAENGDISSRKAVLEAVPNDPNANGVIKIAAYEAANTAVPRPVTPAYTEWENVMNAAFEDIRNGSDPKGSLDSAVQQIQQLVKKYGK